MYCESEAGSCCSTPFVSAPSSPSRASSSSSGANLAGFGKNSKNPASKNSLYYYFSAPSSPPRDHKSATASAASDHQRGFSFTECEFQFQSRFDGSGGGAAAPPGRRRGGEDEDEMEDAGVAGFYFSAPTSPDRRNKERLGKGGCSYWDEMPGTPKMIFGAAAANAAAGDLASGASFFNADSDFEFSSSRMSDSDSTISAQMSSADELFFKGQLLPMKIPPPPQLTSSDSSGSSNTIASTASSSSSSASAAALPPSPRSKKGGGSASPGRVKSAVIGSICGGAAMIKSGSISDSISASLGARGGGGGGGPRSLSPLQLLKKYQSMMLMIGRPSSTNSSSSPSLASSSSTGSSSSDRQPVPRPARTSSKGRTLRELLHLSSMHKRSKPAAPPPKEEASAPASTSAPLVPQEGAKEIKESGAKEIKESVLAAVNEENNPTATPQKANSPSKPLDPISRKLDSSKRFVDKFPDKRFNANTRIKSPGIATAPKKRFHSLDIQSGAAGAYYNPGRRLHSGSIVPEADFPVIATKVPHHRRDVIKSRQEVAKNKRLNYHVAHYRRGSAGGGAGVGGMFHSGPILGDSARFNEVLHGLKVGKGGGGDQMYYYSNSGASSACSSRNVSPRRSRNNSVNSSNSCNIINLNNTSNSLSSSSGGGGISLHELHYKSQQRVTSEEMRRKTFLPYKQGLLGCLGCATMRIAGLSKSLQPMASSR